MKLHNTFSTELPWACEPVTPTPLSGARLLHLNRSLLTELGLADVSDADWLACCGQGRPLPGMAPVAQVYAGHQFGSYVPRLGDGRALLLGQQEAPDGQLWDLHLKGAGKTPFSRFGDGRAVLRSSIREYLASEALHALGISTTRALVLVGSNEAVQRETLEPGATVLRAAPSHLRFGHIEYFAWSGQGERIPALLDYLRVHHFDGLDNADLFAEVVRRTALLIARWQAAGFTHGVLNTDNMSLLGLTLDYGPYGFIDRYVPDFVCNHTDSIGRYALDQQPAVGYWNLQKLAQALAGHLPDAALQQALDSYQQTLMLEYSTLMRERLGLQSWEEDDPALFRRLFQLLAAGGVDYHLFLRRLARLNLRGELPPGLLVLLPEGEAWPRWLDDYRARLAREGSQDDERARRMEAVNPKYVLRNALAQRAIDAAEAGDMAPFIRLFEALRHPFDEQPEAEDLATPSPDWYQCTTLSCSS
ncbi:protein adenylyltransferase SelO [Aeromonas simiae]|uniref:protein adenylyltransferase SelO n=1 Tax=Aeromonas simiae TaxID=218936 RepID=UPI00266C34AD|nr:YdiU family protein [Aeromonas simiae]MDO2949515.1 YdiU family protein [Aeromonas simiae]MDO2953179.1 YdiU family protein [Aeromonas simiae]MDO2956884.1 YdiU family protein [Aeromonas simiae]